MISEIDIQKQICDTYQIPREVHRRDFIVK